MLRPEFVRRKLQLIAEELGRLVELRDVEADELAGDPIRLAAAERMIERIVVRAIDVNEHLIWALSTGAEKKITRLTYGDTFLRLADHGVYPADFARRMAESARLRDILVHRFDDADRPGVHAFVRPVLQDYTRYVESVRAFLEQREAGDAGG